MTAPNQSVTSRDLILAARQGLLPTREAGRLGGFGNLFNKEMGEWFGTRRWWMQTLVWLLLINGLLAFILSAVGAGAPNVEPTPEEIFVEGMAMLYGFLASFGAMGVIALAQDEIIKEKQSGTAAWILSKPISRLSFVLAKLISNILGSLIFIIVLPGTVGYLEIVLASDTAPDILPYITGLGVAFLSLLFYLTLTLMLGTLFEQRAPVLGIAFGVLLSGSFVLNLAPDIAYVMPAALHAIAPAVAMSQPLPDFAVPELISTVVLSLVFTIVALWRFSREEF